MPRSILTWLKRLPIDLGQGHLRFTTKGKLLALDLVPDGNGGWALDVGCREGAQSQWLRSRGYRVASVDVEPLCERAIAADANAPLPFRSGQFDLVWCSEVIEHLRDPVQFRTEVERVLAPGGRLILTTPNSAFWLYWIARLFGKSPRDLQNPDHEHFFSTQDIRALFPGARVYGYFPYFLIKSRITRAVGPLSPTFVVEYSP